MAKYPRGGDGFFGLHNSFIVWGFILGLLLAGGFFLLGTYYGYNQAIQETAPSINAKKKPTSPEQDKKQSEQPKKQEEKQVNQESTKPEAIITEKDLEDDSESEKNLKDDSEMDDNETEPETAVETVAQGNEEPSSPETEESSSPTSSATQDQYEREDRSETEIRATALFGGSQGAEDSPSTGGVEESTSDQETDEQQVIRSSGPTFTIQVFSSQSEDRAKKSLNNLTEDGYKVTLTETTINGNQWYRVRLGKFPTKNKAEARADLLVEEGVIEDYWISQLNT